MPPVGSKPEGEQEQKRPNGLVKILCVPRSASSLKSGRLMSLNARVNVDWLTLDTRDLCSFLPSTIQWHTL